LTYHPCEQACLAGTPAENIEGQPVRPSFITRARKATKISPEAFRLERNGGTGQLASTKKEK